MAAAILFCVSLVATLYAASVFADRLDHLGELLGLPEAIIGLLTALAADGPELSSAIFALAQGRHDVGLGVVVGASLFNLATMLGFSALIAGPLILRRDEIALEGGVALAVVGAVVLWIFGVVPAWAALVIAGVAATTYVAIVGFTRERGRALGEHHRRHGRPPKETLLLIPVAAAVIVLGSVGMVHSALTLGGRAGVPDLLIGTLLLAVLTSLPNAYTGVRLGLARRSSALVSDAMNSNTINLLGGLLIPALFVTFDVSGVAKADLALLLGATALAVVLLTRGMRRAGGVVLIATWVAFVVLQAATA